MTPAMPPASNPPGMAPSYGVQRSALERYFDGTARQAWADLTSNVPVSGIRATVRAGRDRMRATLLDWLPQDLTGARILDAGCGTGALAGEVARRGASVLAVDVAGGLVDLASQRNGADTGQGSIDWRVGDMLDPAFGRFDYVVAMDSLIHYPLAEIADALTALAERTDKAMLFTFAPRTPALAAMHAVGKFFPRADRAPAIQPVEATRLRRRLAELPGWQASRDQRIASGFYTSHALEMVRG